MKLTHDWRRVLTKAWSIRLMLIAGFFSGVEVALPILGDFIHPGYFAALSALTTAAAFVSRIIAQKDMEDETVGED